MTRFKVVLSVAAASILTLGATGFYQGFASIGHPVSHLSSASLASAAPVASPITQPDSGGMVAMAVSTDATADDGAAAHARSLARRAARLLAMTDSSHDNDAAADQPVKTDVAFSAGAADQPPAAPSPSSSAPDDRIQ